MRISTSWANQTALSSMLNQQASLNKTQQEISSGKKLLIPSDNPIAAARAIDLKQSINQNEQYQNNIGTARDRLSQEEGVLKNATDILQKINELGIQGLNDTNSADDRKAIAFEMEELNKQLLSIANTKSPNGEYLFSGSKSTIAPFSKNPNASGVYDYAGNTSSRAIQIDVNRQITDGDVGSSVFGNPTGGSGTLPAPGSIANVFEAIDKFAADLRANTPNSNSLGDISNALDNVLNTRSTVGIRLNVLDQQEEINTDSALEMKTVLSQLEDVDYAEAITRFSEQTISLQAAQQTFSQLKKLSLFNYL